MTNEAVDASDIGKKVLVSNSGERWLSRTLVSVDGPEGGKYECVNPYCNGVTATWTYAKRKKKKQ